MKEFIFRGKIEISGAEFYIQAKTLEEARKKAALGNYGSYDTTTGEVVNWTIDHNSGEENR